MTIKEQLQKARREAKLTQKELADKTGLKQQHISDYENGKRNPTADTIQKIADALGHYWVLTKKKDE